MRFFRFITYPPALLNRSAILWLGLTCCVILMIGACDTVDDVKPNLGQTFIKLFGGRGTEVGKDLLQMPDGGFVLVGSSTSGGKGEDVYVVRTDSLGEVIWEEIYGRNGDDSGNSVILGRDGAHLYVCGETEYFDSLGLGLRDVYVLKFPVDGGVPESFSFGEQNRDEYGKSILDIDGGGFLITSTWETIDTSAFFMIETDENLVAIDKRADYVYGTKGVENLSTTTYEINQSSTLNPPFVCFGSVFEFNSETTQFQSFMYRPTNDKGISPNRYGSGLYDEYCTDAYKTTDKGFVLAGYQDDGVRKREMIVKIDPNRNEIWRRVHSNTFEASIGPCRIIQTQDGGYLVSSKIELADPYNDEISLLKLNSEGEMEWRRIFGSNGSNADDEGAKVIQLSDGNYVMVGTIGLYINSVSESKMCLIKLNPEGELIPMN